MALEWPDFQQATITDAKTFDALKRAVAERCAAAAAGSIRRGAAPELVLPDRGEEKTDPLWIVTVDGRNLWIQED